MITVELFVSGPALSPEAEHDLAQRLLMALSTEDAAPAEVMDAAREFVHVVIQQPQTWATGGPAPESARRYLARVTVPSSWSNDRRFGAHIVPLVTDTIAATEPDPDRLRREPHCVVQIVGLREHCTGLHGRAISTTDLTRLMTQGYRDSGVTPEAPTGAAIDPVCGMPVELADAEFTLNVDGVDYAFCAPSCRKVFAEDTAS
ncbi:ATPase [Nocardia halotolerans]|uniref:ATPase n=1 Tax=Nocardia halotolerans TaxID=1755878 RepID=A0ABV8VNB3_9NOCA